MSTNTKLAEPCLALWQAMNEAGKVGNRTDDKLIVKFLREAGYCIVPIAAHDAEQAQEPVAWMSPGKERLEFSRPDTVYGSHTIPLYTAPAEQAAQPDPCPGCRFGVVCRTPKCGRLKLPITHPLRSAEGKGSPHDIQATESQPDLVCNEDPRAPHGFDRNASHNEVRNGQ